MREVEQRCGYAVTPYSYFFAECTHVWKQESIGKFSRLNTRFLCIPMTSPRWSPHNLFCSLSFKKVNDEKLRSSSTEPNTCTIATSASLMYLGKVATKAVLASSNLYRRVKGFTSKGGSNTLIQFEINDNLNRGCCSSNWKQSSTWEISRLFPSSPIHLG
jgi:hypothetical protein